MIKSLKAKVAVVLNLYLQHITKLYYFAYLQLKQFVYSVNEIMGDLRGGGAKAGSYPFR